MEKEQEQEGFGEIVRELRDLGGKLGEVKVTLSYILTMYPHIIPQDESTGKMFGEVREAFEKLDEADSLLSNIEKRVIDFSLKDQEMLKRIREDIRKLRIYQRLW
jgi:hypothetical protein